MFNNSILRQVMFFMDQIELYHLKMDSIILIIIKFYDHYFIFFISLYEYDVIHVSMAFIITLIISLVSETFTLNLSP